MLGCEVSMDIPTSVPPEQRSWTKDGMLIYSEDVSVDVFTMANPLFQGGVFDPDVIVAPDDGSIVYRTQFNNVTAPNVLQMEGVTEDQARDIIFDFALGTWECTLGNILGNTTVTSVIRECGEFLCIIVIVYHWSSELLTDSMYPTIIMVGSLNRGRTVYKLSCFIPSYQSEDLHKICLI